MKQLQLSVSLLLQLMIFGYIKVQRTNIFLTSENGNEFRLDLYPDLALNISKKLQEQEDKIINTSLED